MDYRPAKNLLSNKVILVTGASDGIGREAARCYAEHEANIILLGRSKEKLQQAKREIDAISINPVTLFSFDFLTAQPSHYQKLAQHISAVSPHLDGVLHSAGMLGHIAPIAEQNPIVWQQVMKVNVNAQFMLTQALLPLLLNAQHSSLIFTSSSVGHKGRANWGAYSVSKFATEGLMQVLADEYSPQQLRVNCINPGATRTHMRAEVYPNEDPMTLKAPVDIMAPYLYLMGADSEGVTGQVIDAQPKK